MSMHDPLAASTADSDHLTTGDPIALLEEDHEAVDALFRRSEDAGLDPPTEVLRDIADLLATHALLEEELVYPKVSAELARRSAGEHAVVTDLVARMLAAVPGSGEVPELLGRLVADVRAHVAEERAEVFPALEQSLTSDERRALGAQVAAAKGAGSPLTDAEYPVSDASVSSDDSPGYVDEEELEES